MNPVEVLQAEATKCELCRREGLLCVKGDKCAPPLVQEQPPWPVRVLAVSEAPNFGDSFTYGRITLDLDETGRAQRELFESVGIRPEEVLFTNCVLCLPAKARDGKFPVSARQQALCADWLGRFIEEADPLVVVTFGVTALRAVDRLERHGLKLSTSVGRLHPWKRRRLLPLYHPGRRAQMKRPKSQQREDISVLREALPEAPVLTAAMAKEVTQAHPDGARLVLRSASGEVHNDIACSIGFQWGRTPVFAYLAHREDGPPFWSEARVFVERLSRRGDTWVIDCRDERGIREVEVHALSDDEGTALRSWLESLPAGAVEAMANAMRAMLDPRAL